MGLKLTDNIIKKAKIVKVRTHLEIVRGKFLSNQV